MKYDYPDVKNIVVCGDIHGAYEEMVFKLCVQYGMTDTLLIIAGDCGFGFEKPGYYEQVFNHDDPAYFQEQRIHHERFRCVPDYSIITACSHTILCIGGAISIDRTYRLTVDSRPRSAQTACYWADEMPYFDEYALAEINNKYKVDIVVTHTAPSFCELLKKDGLMGWSKRDETLLEDCDRERATLDRIFDSLKKAGQPLTHWYYGHFHQSWSSTIYGVLFSMLDIMEFKEVQISSFSCLHTESGIF